MDIKVGTRLKSKHTSKICTVTEVDVKWGRYSVKWDKPYRGCRTHHELGQVSIYFTVVPPVTKQIERADELLKRANGGLDDSWREYD